MRSGTQGPAAHRRATGSHPFRPRHTQDLHRGQQLGDAGDGDEQRPRLAHLQFFSVYGVYAPIQQP